MFSGSYLRTLRQYHGLTQRELADRVALSASSISLYETGQREPDAEVVQAFCDVLGVLPGAFNARHVPLDDSGFNFRALRSTPLWVRLRHSSHVELVERWVRHIRELILLPPTDVPEFSVDAVEDIESAALSCREHWQLGLGPIHRTTRVLENAGIVVTQIHDNDVRVDAFSSLNSDPLIVALSSAKGSASREIFDKMHELGHLSLHRRDRGKTYQQKEAEANYFSGAFLLPAESFGREFRTCGGTLGDLLELKMRWGVSVPAMVYRAHQLDLISTARYRQLMKGVSKRGWRRGVAEPGEPESHPPELLPNASRRFLEASGQTVEEAAEQVGWKLPMFRSVTGLAEDILPATGAEMLSLDEYRQRRAQG